MFKVNTKYSSKHVVKKNKQPPAQFHGFFQRQPRTHNSVPTEVFLSKKISIIDCKSQYKP